MVDSEIRDVVIKFVNVLASKGVRVDKAVLFGSCSSGSFSSVSDIDIAIVSPDFGKDRFEEGKLLFQTAWRVDPRIEPVPISSEAYEHDTWVPLIYEIREKGLVIKAA
jgi:predicted nucleotidyltransferase